MNAYQATKNFDKCWRVERNISCINGLMAWFTICYVHHPDEEEVMYTDGEIGSEEKTAKEIASALNGFKS